MASKKVEDYAQKAGLSNNAAKRALGLKHEKKAQQRLTPAKAEGGKRAKKLAAKPAKGK